MIDTIKFDLNRDYLKDFQTDAYSALQTLETLDILLDTLLSDTDFIGTGGGDMALRGALHQVFLMKKRMNELLLSKFEEMRERIVSLENKEI